MTYNQTLKYIHSLGNFSLPAGLDRIKNVLEKLGNPHRKLKAIHIAGTNGKGSVATMLHSVFKEAGLKTGLFISPFVIDFRERIQINGEYISESDLTIFAKKVRDTGIILTEFEFITATAFLYFSESNIDILVCETGLGGRLDATNILENKILSVITKIGLDHTAILGNTIKKIATEKCGIIKNSAVITSPYQCDEAIKVIKSHAKELIIPDIKKFKTLSKEEPNTYRYKEQKYTLNLLGEYQAENLLVALETIFHSGYQIPYHIIYKGLKKAFFSARMEVISKNPLVVLDGAHNIDGASVLSKELAVFSGEVTAIIGMMRDKDYDKFLKTVLINCKNAITVEVLQMPRSLTAQELCSYASNYCPCEAAEDYDDAIKKAKQKSNGQPIFIFGSLYLASGIRPYLYNHFKLI